MMAKAAPSLADIAETVSYAFLAGVTLVGLRASMAFGLWWLQYVAGFAFLVWLVPETREAIETSRHGGAEATRR